MNGESVSKPGNEGWQKEVTMRGLVATHTAVSAILAMSGRHSVYLPVVILFGRFDEEKQLICGRGRTI